MYTRHKVKDDYVMTDSTAIFFTIDKGGQKVWWVTQVYHC